MTTEESFRDRAEGVSFRHDLVEISCLEPVPEGRIAESYAATRFDRPFTCFSSGVRTPSGLHSPSSQPPQISTFISSKQNSATTSSTTTTLTTALSTGTEISRPGEEHEGEEEIAEDTAGVDGSDSEVDSSTSSASEAPLRVSRAITVPHVIAASAGKTTPADASVTDKSANIADTVAPETPGSQATCDSKKEEERATSAEQEPSKSRGSLSTEASVESISSLPLPPDMPPPAEEEEEEAGEGGEAEFGEQMPTTQPSRKRSRRKRSRHVRRSSGSKPVTGDDEPSLV
ncbi:unnamed protein product [Dibothriocephalus latus]|uniref:Uncharacterized protein n=1 Tax=Dibothriocephalus latus TaxID=60516 RepID=A0A3P6TLS0_DIBLA|nr:unnamed protein product [Dibothriocephalus latus]